MAVLLLHNTTNNYQALYQISESVAEKSLTENIARSERSSHIPGGSHQRLGNFQRKVKIVKEFIILNQVVSEKTMMKNVHIDYIRVTEGKIENLKKEGKIRINTLIFIYTISFAYLKVYIS